jgi:nitrogen fixation protein FixH
VPISGEERVFQVEVLDRSGDPLESAAVTVEFLRPSDHRQDRRLRLDEISPGRYQGTIALPQPGLWDVMILISRDDDLHEIHGTTSVRAPAAS